MSQLSFADFFNMARESADNPPVIQVRAQVAEVVPSVQRMMSEQHSRSRFIRVFKDTGRHLGRWEVFSDFLSLAASELSLPCRVSILTQIQHRACCILIRMRRFHRGDKYPPLFRPEREFGKDRIDVPGCVHAQPRAISPDIIFSRRAAFSIRRGGNKGVYKRFAPLYFLPVGCKLPFAAQ